ncbi:LysR family transcriptional regulator [Aeromonas veronii]
MKGSTYNQLLVFRAIAQAGSLTLAAKRLEMKPPSVSQALKNLEAEIGLPLFSRTTRQIELTEAGKALLNRTQSLLTELTFEFESIKGLSIEPTGKLRITVPRFVYQWVLAPIYVEFCLQFPNIELEISISDALVDITTEGFDLGIRLGQMLDHEMVARSLTVPLKDAIFASPLYIEEYGIPETLSALNSHKLIQYRFINANEIAPLIMQEDNQDISISMPTALVVNDTDLMFDAAKSGLGIGRMLEPLATPFFDKKELVPILKSHWRNYSGLYIYFNKNAPKAKRIRIFIDFLLERTHHLRDG